MDFRELRIGNFINDQGKILQVDRINSQLVKSSDPIPITPEWLKKFKIRKIEQSTNNIGSIDYSTDKPIDAEENPFFIQIRFFPDDGSTYYRIADYHLYKTKFKEIKYVHQLQNLYFALTGKELGHEENKAEILIGEKIKGYENLSSQRAEHLKIEFESGKMLQVVFEKPYLTVDVVDITSGKYKTNELLSINTDG